MTEITIENELIVIEFVEYAKHIFKLTRVKPVSATPEEYAQVNGVNTGVTEIAPEMLEQMKNQFLAEKKGIQQSDYTYHLRKG